MRIQNLIENTDVGNHLLKIQKESEFIQDDFSHDILQTAKELAQLPTQFITGHCTGLPAYELLKEVMGDQLNYLRSGEAVDF